MKNQEVGTNVGPGNTLIKNQEVGTNVGPGNTLM